MEPYNRGARVASPKESGMQLLDNWFGMVLSYLVWIWTVALAHNGDIISFLGFILLVARLVHDVPKAYTKIKGWFQPKE